MSEILSVKDLTVRYGGMTAVNELSIEVRPGSAIGLIGPNGAGKTSVIDALSGFAHASGTVHLGDTALNELAPYARVRAGLARTFQSLELFDDLSVKENIAIGEPRTRSGIRMSARSEKDERGGQTVWDLDRLLDLFELREDADRKVSDLSQGYRKLTTVARALASWPKVVLLDEPAAGLDRSESVWLGQKLKDVVDAGTGILLVDHDMSLVLSICSFIYVLNFGNRIAAGTPEQIRSDEEVVLTYLGESKKQQGELNGSAALG